MTAAAPRADLEVSYRVEFAGDEGMVFASVNGHDVGGLRWDYVNAHPPRALDLSVDELYRRRGIARAMFSLAQRNESTLVHSDALTDDGRAFVAALTC